MVDRHTGTTIIHRVNLPSSSSSSIKYKALKELCDSSESFGYFSETLFIPEVQYHISTYVGLYMILSRPSNFPDNNNNAGISSHYLSHQEDAMDRLLQMWSSFSPLMAAFIESPNSFLHDLLTQQPSLNNKHNTTSNHILSSFPTIGLSNLLDYSKTLFNNSANLISHLTTSESATSSGFLHEQLRYKISSRQHRYILDKGLINFSSSHFPTSNLFSKESGLVSLLAKPNLTEFDHTPPNPFLVECKHSTSHSFFHRRIRQFSDQISKGTDSGSFINQQESTLYLSAFSSQQDDGSSIAQNSSNQVDYSLEGQYIRKPFSFSNLLRLHSYLQANFFDYEQMTENSSEISGTSPNLLAVGDDSLVMSPSIGSTGTYIPSILYREIKDNTKKEEGHLFSQFGTKFKETLELLKEKGSRLTQRKKDLTPEELEDMEAMKQFGQKPPMQNALGLSKCLSAAMNAPAYALFRDENQRRGIPVILSMVKLKIVESDDTVVSFTSYTTFKIELEYNNIKWTIFRRTIDFVKLHMILTLRHYQGHLPKLPSFPSHISYFLELRHNRHQRAKRDKNLIKVMLAAAARRKALQDYLLEVLYAVHMHISTEIFEFLEISVHSLLPRIGWKGKEGYLRKKVTEDVGPSYLPWCLLYTYSTFENQWFIIRPSYVAWSSNPDRYVLTDVMLVDKGFRVTFEEESGMKLDSSKLEAYSILESIGLADTVFPNSTSLISRKLPKLITLRNSASQTIVLKPVGDFQLFYWIQDLQKLLYNNSYSYEFGLQSAISSTQGSGEYSRIQQFDSFAPVRQKQYVQFFVDGDSFFRSVANALLRARRQVFLSGWWISPELYLKRPNNLYPEYRLDKLLQKIASKGVMVYVLIYKEVPLSLPIDSAYTKATLESLHPNIRVQRHPDHLPGGVLYWAHHEKLIIIDQRLAYTGGLDLCYGRYDTPEHRLSDRLVSLPAVPPEMNTISSRYPNPSARKDMTVEFANESLKPDQSKLLSDGQSGNFPYNEKLKQDHPGFPEPSNPVSIPGEVSSYHSQIKSPLNYDKSPEMGYESQPPDLHNLNSIKNMIDSSSTMTIAGSVMELPVLDHLTDNLLDSVEKFKSVKPIAHSFDQYSVSDPLLIGELPRHSISRGESTLDALTWLGLDYSNPRLRDFRNVRQPYLDILDRQIHPRMPWHDINVCIFTKPHISNVPSSSTVTNSDIASSNSNAGTNQCTPNAPFNSCTSSCARDLARHFISKWNFVKREKSMHKPMKIPFLVPDEGEFSDREDPYPEFHDFSAEFADKKISLDNPKNKSEIQCRQGIIEGKSYMVTAQILRSAGTWSLGLTNTEQSIQDAYLHLIRTSKYYIYIENQFFITRILLEEDINRAKNNMMQHQNVSHQRRHSKQNRGLSAVDPSSYSGSQENFNSTEDIPNGVDFSNASIEKLNIKSTSRNAEFSNTPLPSVGKLPSSGNISSVNFENLVGNALYDRIILAHHRQEIFRVIIVLPLLPAFENDVSDSTASSVRILLQAQLQSIRKGGGLLDALERAGVPIDNYILFVSLRKFENTAAPVPAPKLESTLPHPSVANAVPLKPPSLDPLHLNEHLSKEKDLPDRSSFHHDANVDHSQSLNFVNSDDRSVPKIALQDSKVADFEQAFINNASASSISENITADHTAAPLPSEVPLEIFSPSNAIPLSIQEQYLTEQIYVHSKIIIVDDMYAILGSANINDRSLAGYKDGEIAIYLSEEHSNAKGPMNGKSVTVGQGIRDLRLNLWKEHLGILDNPRSQPPSTHGSTCFDSPFSIPSPLTVSHIEDPVTDSCFHGVFKGIATRNTEIYRQVFHCLPDDSVRNWKQYREFSDKKAKKKEFFPSEEVPIKTMVTVDQQPPFKAIHSVLEPSLIPPPLSDSNKTQSMANSKPLVNDNHDTLPEDTAINGKGKMNHQPAINSSDELILEKNGTGDMSNSVMQSDHSAPKESHPVLPHSNPAPPTSHLPTSNNPSPHHKYDPLAFIQGYLVLYPTLFLEEEDLGASLLSPEWMLPSDLYY